MKIPIPEDWDGETWKRFSVCWPDSPSWIALLNGFVTTPMRGRFWDERTGSIVGVQATGRQIFQNNDPLDETCMTCEECGAFVEELQNVTAQLAIIAGRLAP